MQLDAGEDAVTTVDRVDARRREQAVDDGLEDRPRGARRRRRPDLFVVEQGGDRKVLARVRHPTGRSTAAQHDT